jgi:uncharacterized protein YeaO (DUF488 family)
MQIWMKRAYENPGPQDGLRVLVDRLWPRGISKDKAEIDLWLKEIGPSHELRKWFGHDPEKWEEFKRRYTCELNTSGGEVLKKLRRLASQNRITLVFGAKDERFNNARALKEYLEKASSPQR